MKEDKEKVLKYKSVHLAVQCMWKTKLTVVTSSFDANGR
jgi:hypothetical protein